MLLLSIVNPYGIRTIVQYTKISKSINHLIKYVRHEHVFIVHVLFISNSVFQFSADLKHTGCQHSVVALAAVRMNANILAFASDETVQQQCCSLI